MGKLSVTFYAPCSMCICEKNSCFDKKTNIIRTITSIILNFNFNQIYVDNLHFIFFLSIHIKQPDYKNSIYNFLKILRLK